MSENIRGVIQQVPKPREFVKGDKVTYYYSIKVNDVYYSVGSKVPPAAGTTVEFSAEKNARGYWDVTKAGLKLVSAGEPNRAVGASAVAVASSGSGAGAMSKDDYWRRKEERDLAKEAMYEARDKVIQLQSCRNSAIEFVKLLLLTQGVDKEGVPVPSLKLPAAPAKREELLAKTVEKYTEEFVKANDSLNNNEEGDKNNNEEASSSNNDEAAADRSDEAWQV